MAEVADQDVLEFLKEELVTQFWYHHYTESNQVPTVFYCDQRFHPLQVASEFGLNRVVQKLLPRPNRNERPPSCEILQACLRRAAWNGFDEIMILLMDAGAIDSQVLELLILKN